MNKIIKLLVIVILSLIIVFAIIRVFVGVYAYNKIQHDTDKAVELFDSLNSH